MTGDDLKKIVEFANKKELINWWYEGCLFDKSDNKMSEWTFISNFVVAHGFVDNMVCILVPPDESDPSIDLSSWGLKAGCIKTSDKELNVTCQTNNWMTGGYPEWKVHLERSKDEHNYIIDLTFRAEVDSNFRRYEIEKSHLDHFACFKQRASGTVTIDGEVFPVSGNAYYEMMSGFIDPKASRGWYWYCIPRTDSGELAINIALGLTPKDEIFHRFIYFTEDGKNFGEFLKYDFEILEERDYQGIKYPFKLKISEKNENGELNAVITRATNPAQDMHQTPFGTVAFITGNAHVVGKIVWKGKEYDIKGRSIGSNFLIIY